MSTFVPTDPMALWHWVNGVNSGCTDPTIPQKNTANIGISQVAVNSEPTLQDLLSTDLPPLYFSIVVDLSHTASVPESSCLSFETLLRIAEIMFEIQKGFFITSAILDVPLPGWLSRRLPRPPLFIPSLGPGLLALQMLRCNIDFQLMQVEMAEADTEEEQFRIFEQTFLNCIPALGPAIGALWEQREEIEALIEECF